MRFLWVVVALVMIAAGSGVQAQGAEIRHITVSGEGEIGSTPDMAIITVGVSAQHRVAAAAMDEVSGKVATLLLTLTKQGLDPADIQTSSLNLNPRYQHSNDGTPPKIVGFMASNTVTIRVRALDELGTLLGQVLETGVNQINGLQFGVSDSQSLEDQARIAAIADARHRAEIFAGAAGVKLGRVVSISEAGGGVVGGAVMEMAAMARADVVPIAQGEVMTRSQVSVVYELLDVE